MSSKRKFLYFSTVLLFLSVIAEKAFYIFSNISSSDIFFTSDSGFLALVPQISHYASLFFDNFFFAVSVTAVVFAVFHFGRKASHLTLYLSCGAKLSGFIIIFFYNIFRNKLDSVQLTVGAFSMLIELLFFVICIFASLFIAKQIAVKRAAATDTDKVKRYTEKYAILFSYAIIAFFKCVDLTVYVINSFKNVIDVTTEEILAVILDYVECIALFPAFGLLISFLIFRIIVKITGDIKYKKYFAPCVSEVISDEKND